MNPAMLQMLQAGAAGGARPPAAVPQAPPAAAAIGRMLQGQRMTPQGSGQMEGRILEQCMVQIGKVLQIIMMSNPKAYQTLLKAQMSLHSALQELKQGAQDQQEHAQMTNSLMQLLKSSQGGPSAVPGAGPAGGAGQQLS
jgi:hypothetical protein